MKTVVMPNEEAHLHSLLDALGWPRVILGVQVGQEQGVYEC